MILIAGKGSVESADALVFAERAGAAAVIELSGLDADLSLRKPAAQFGEALSERLAESFEVLARYGGAVLL